MLDAAARHKQINSIDAVPDAARCVLYIMSRDQRLKDNHALLAAHNRATELSLPLLIGFALYPRSRKRAKEYVDFMLDGLEQLYLATKKQGISFVIKVGNPAEVYGAFLSDYRPAAVYFDMNPLRLPSHLRTVVANQADCPVYVVDTHNIVPLWHASDKQEYAARTFRPKFHKYLNDFFLEPETLSEKSQLPQLEVASPDFQAIRQQLDYQPAGVTHGYVAGEEAAAQKLQNFLQHRFSGYAVNRNDPTVDGLSNLSPYLHFGHISSLRVLLEAKYQSEKNNQLTDDFDALLEEMGVRKELSDNYCYHNQNYDKLAGAPEWAQKTVTKHADDHREHLYSRSQFEQAKTQDQAWNAAQLQLLNTGKIHGYMRMYWAKKVFEWSESAEVAIDTLVYLNDFYSIDGGDPNGYVGILWSVAGLHDRPWQERPVYGTVRSMVFNGLKRKFDVQQYIDKYTNK